MADLKTPEGKAVDLDAVKADANSAFDAAMAGEAPEVPAPPKVTRTPKDDARPRTRRVPSKDEKPRTTAKTPLLSDEQRAQGVAGLVQVGAGLCLVAKKATGKDAFQADAVTLASNAEQIADACVQTAKNDARFAAALDRVMAVGPYAALVSVMVGVGSQIVRNHRPSLSLPGTVDPAKLIKAQDEAAAQQKEVAGAALCRSGTPARSSSASGSITGAASMCC